MTTWKWSHGFKDWEWNDNFRCWFRKGHSEGFNWFCLGDRMFHGTFGAKDGDIVYHGSYTGDWHGGIQTPSLFEALYWLRKAKGNDKEAWSG